MRSVVGLGLTALALLLGALAPAAQGRTVFNLPPGNYSREDWRPVTGGLVHQDDSRLDTGELVRIDMRGRKRRLRQFDVLRPLLRSGRDADSTSQGTLTFTADGRWVAAAANASTTVFEGAGEDSYSRGAQLVTATLDGRASRVESCRTGYLEPFAIDAGRLFYRGCNGGLVVYELATARRLHAIAPVEDKLYVTGVMAGPYVAFYAADSDGPEGSGALVVYDWKLGREVYRIERPEDWALGHDGTTVATFAAGPDAHCLADRVAWFSVADPVAHDLPFRACESTVAIAGRSVVVHRRVRDERSEPRQDRQRPLVRQDVVVADLPGGPPRVVLPAGNPGDSAPWLASDYDGSRLVYLAEACYGANVVIDPIESLLDRGPPRRSSCSVSFRSLRRVLRPRSDSTVKVAFACPHGCDGRIGIWVPRLGRYVGEDGFRLFGGAAPSKRAQVLFKLEPADRRALRRAGRLRAELRLRVSQPSGGQRLYRRRFTLEP